MTRIKHRTASLNTVLRRAVRHMWMMYDRGDGVVVLLSTRYGLPLVFREGRLSVFRSSLALRGE